MSNSHNVYSVLTSFTGIIFEIVSPLANQILIQPNVVFEPIQFFLNAWII